MVKSLSIEPKWISKSFLNGYYLNKLSHSVQKNDNHGAFTDVWFGCKRYKQHTNLLQLL